MAETELSDPNKNPWYVLMTLYGEQTEKFDSKLAKQNLDAWNIWAISDMDPETALSESRQVDWDPRQISFSSADISLLFERAMKERNGADFAIPALPTPQLPIDMTRLRFTAPLSAKKYIFPKAVDFFESVFENSFNLSSANFVEIAKIQRCEFGERAIIANAIYQGTAEFYQSVFGDNFYASTTKFEKFANFAGCNFKGGADFSDVVFSGVAHFNDTAFHAEIGIATHMIKFNDASFEKPVNFRKARFFNRYPIFAGTIFHDNSNFSPEDEYWPPLETAEPVNAKEFCARAKILLAKQGFSEEEHQFFRREMAFSGRLGSWWRRFPYRIFGIFSNYGESIARPLICLLVLWLIPMLILLFYFSWVRTFQETAWTYWHAAGLSFSNIFTIFGFHRIYFDMEMVRGLPGVLQLMGASQTILAVPLLFFLGLGLRTRFRLR